MNEFVEVKTSELIGAALDWAVAKSTGMQIAIINGSVRKYESRLLYRPSFEWHDGGRLIEEYQLDLTFERCGLIYAYQCYGDGLPIITTEDNYGSSGPTHLIAACRAIVHAKLGETVLVPKELVK